MSTYLDTGARAVLGRVRDAGHELAVVDVGVLAALTEGLVVVALSGRVSDVLGETAAEPLAFDRLALVRRRARLGA
jgi:hypothetical protein